MLFRFGKILLDFLFPIHCAGCKRESTYCCNDCFSKISVCAQSCAPDKNLNSLTAIICASKFEEKSMIAKLIHIFKYDFAKEICFILADLFDEKMRAFLNSDCVLVPVPLHRRRLNFRGFNQSALLAGVLSKKWSIPVAHILQRHKYTTPQVELNMTKRLSNVTGAFSMKNPDQILNPEINYFLVDDVCTTGSTLNECAAVLKNHGAGRVYGLVIAKT